MTKRNTYKIPCEGCLILPICKERLKQIDQDPHSQYKGSAGWVILKELCKIVKDYLKTIQYYGEWNKNLGQFEDDLKRVYGEVYRPSIKYYHYKKYNYPAI
jgi:hypothetical protein